MSSGGTNPAQTTSRAKKLPAKEPAVGTSPQPSQPSSRLTAKTKLAPSQRPCPILPMGGLADHSRTTQAPTRNPITASMNAGSGFTELPATRSAAAPSKALSNHPPSVAAAMAPEEASHGRRPSNVASQAARAACSDAESSPPEVVFLRLFETMQNHTTAGYMQQYERHQVEVAGHQRNLMTQLKEKKEECTKLRGQLLHVENLRAEERGRSEVEKKNLRRQLEEGETDAERNDRERVQKEDQEKEKEGQERVTRHLLEKHEEQRKLWKQERDQWAEEKAALLIETKKVEFLGCEVKRLEEGKNALAKELKDMTHQKADLEMELVRRHTQHERQRKIWGNEKTIMVGRLRDERRALNDLRMEKRKRDEEDADLSESATKRQRLEPSNGSEEEEGNYEDDCDEAEEQGEDGNDEAGGEEVEKMVGEDASEDDDNLEDEEEEGLEEDTDE